MPKTLSGLFAIKNLWVWRLQKAFFHIRSNKKGCVGAKRQTNVNESYWADDKQSKAQNLDSKYRQIALIGFDT